MNSSLMCCARSASAAESSEPSEKEEEEEEDEVAIASPTEIENEVGGTDTSERGFDLRRLSTNIVVIIHRLCAQRYPDDVFKENERFRRYIIVSPKRE